MGRPRTSPLPEGVYARRLSRGRVVYWFWFYDAEGVRVQMRGGPAVSDAVSARREKIAEVRAGRFTRGRGSSSQTLERYASTWIGLRRGEGVRTVDREDQILRDHVLPTLGATRLADLRPQNVASWVRELVAAGEMAAKSILNAHGVLSAMLSRARFDELVIDNVAQGLPPGVLPRAGKRVVPPWTREECEVLMGHPDIPRDRRIAHAIASFTATRVGEVAGFRKRDVDWKARPMPMWRLDHQYDDRPLKTERARGENPRCIPLHPVLVEMLEAWLRDRDGWAELVGRFPTDDDYIVPRPDGRVHSKSSLGAKSVHRAARLAGIAIGERDFHSFRRAMITCARVDGARADVLERITHNAAGEMIDGYTLFGWEPLCEAVGCLRMTPATYASVEAIGSKNGRVAVTQSVTRAESLA